MYERCKVHGKIFLLYMYIIFCVFLFLQFSHNKISYIYHNLYIYIILLYFRKRSNKYTSKSYSFSRLYLQSTFFMLYITFSQSVSLASLWFKHIKRAFQFSPAFYQLANIKLYISKVLTLTRNKKVSNMIDLIKKNFM